MSDPYRAPPMLVLPKAGGGAMSANVFLSCPDAEPPKKPRHRRRDISDAAWMLTLGRMSDTDLALAVKHQWAVRRRAARAEVKRREALDA